MGFTIICNKCGNKQEFKPRGEARRGNVEIDVIQTGYENAVTEIVISCENDKCNQIIEVIYR